MTPENRLEVRAAALLLVRYCGFYNDPKFLPWYAEHARVLQRTVDCAVRMTLGEGRPNHVALSTEIELVLDSSDPDGPPFESEIVDHLVFASEVLDYLISPARQDLQTRAFERAQELAEAHEELGDAEYQGDWVHVNFAELESEARSLDLAEHDASRSLARSRNFAVAYADVISNCYTDEDAGRS